MKTTDPEKVVHEIAKSTHNDEELVSRMFAEAVEQYRRDAHAGLCAVVCSKTSA
jgi:hypothetical protein